MINAQSEEEPNITMLGCLSDECIQGMGGVKRAMAYAKKSSDRKHAALARFGL